MSPRTRPLIDRFSTKYRINSETGCWEWTAAKLHDGYGQIGLGPRGSGFGRAHRVSYELFCGPIPDGMLVCHECDNRICVNPKHLFLGTSADNLADMTAKGRRARVGHHGASNPSAKLTAADAAAIRSATNAHWRELAQRYSVGKTTICGIRSGRLWPSPRPEDASDFLNRPSAKPEANDSATPLSDHAFQREG